MIEPKVQPGQVYDWPDHPGYGRVVIDCLGEIGSRGEEMWKFIGGNSMTNVAFCVNRGEMRLYSQNSLNA